MLSALLLLPILSSPVTWCGDDGTLHVELAEASLELRDQRPVLSRPRAGHQVSTLSTGRIYRGAHPVDRVEWRGPDGEARRLQIDGEGWKLYDGEGEELRDLRVPSGFRRGVPPMLLGVKGAFAWFVSSTHLARADLAAERQHVKTGRLSRKTLDWIYVSAGERARFIDGEKIIDCEPSLRCEELLALDGVVERVAPHVDGLLLATDARVARLEVEEGTDGESKPMLTTILEGRASAVCSAPDHRTSWFALEVDDGLDLVRLEREPERFALVELLARALPNASSDAAEAWADALVDTEWPGRRALAEAFSEAKSASLRKVAALIWGSEGGNPALARLWLLGHDADLEVRITAVHASSSWCHADETMPCRAVLAAFINDPDDEVSWAARDLLLDVDPWAALDGAPAPYRLEAVSHLSSRLAARGEPRVREVLQRLTADADPSVRAAAQMAVFGE